MLIFVLLFHRNNEAFAICNAIFTNDLDVEKFCITFVAYTWLFSIRFFFVFFKIYNINKLNSLNFRIFFSAPFKYRNVKMQNLNRFIAIAINDQNGRDLIEYKALTSEKKFFFANFIEDFFVFSRKWSFLCVVLHNRNPIKISIISLVVSLPNTMFLDFLVISPFLANKSSTDYTFPYLKWTASRKQTLLPCFILIYTDQLPLLPYNQTYSHNGILWGRGARGREENGEEAEVLKYRIPSNEITFQMCAISFVLIEIPIVSVYNEFVIFIILAKAPMLNLLVVLIKKNPSSNNF